MLVARNYPKSAKDIYFEFKNNPDFGMLNLCCWKNEIKKIKDYNKKTLNNKSIKIYYPLFDHFYVKEYHSKNGFTFENIIEKIYQTGIQAAKYNIKMNPHHYEHPISPENSLGEYAITSSKKGSNIKTKDNRIYISLQH